MLILGLLGMYFDAAVVFFTISSFLFRMASAMLLLSLASTGKHNDVESRGRGLPASAATLSRG